jgi:hypothetical protein
MMMGMTESELRDTFAKNPSTRAGYRGIYARDELRNAPPLEEANTFIVLNSGERKSGGLHWIGIFRAAAGQLLYLDPLGAEPTLTCVFNYFRKHPTVVVEYNDVPMQSILSSRCGEFVCVYCAELCHGLKFEEIQQGFYKTPLLLTS